MTEARVVPLQPYELDDAQRAFLAPFTDAKGRYPNIFGILCRDLPLMEVWRDFGIYLMRGSKVDPVLREVLILRTAQNCACEYEWYHHERIARSLGMTDEQLKQIRKGSCAVDSDLGLMIRCADELSAARRLGDDVWDAMIGKFGLEYSLDAIFTVGAYTALAMGLNSCDVAVEGRSAAPDRAAGPDR